MYLADLHTHSRCSIDGKHTMAELAEAAVKAGLHELCFTDHVDQVAWRGYEPPERFDWSPLVCDFAQAKERWGDRINLRLGVELGDMCVDYPRAERYLSDMPEMDLVIGSLHAMSERFNRLDLYDIDQVIDSFDDVVEDYLREQLDHIRWGKFDVLSHLTLPLRWAKERCGREDVSFDSHMDGVEAVLRAVIDKGLALECNTNRGNMPLPHGEILRLYRALGGELITLGSDGHSTEQIGLGIREGQELLRSCGFRYFCTYEKRTSVFHKL